MKEQKINIEKPAPIGTVVEWMSDTIPSNWLVLDGTAISRNDYSELFELLGTKYGEGDGTTFNLPDLKGKTIIELEQNQIEFNTLGKTGGEITHKLTIDEMPKHRPDTAKPIPYDSGLTNKFGALIDQVGYGKYTALFTETEKILFNEVGKDQSHNNLQPYFVANYIIKAKDEMVEIKLPKPSTLHAKKTDTQIINQDYQILTFNNNLTKEELKLENNKILVNSDVTTLILNTTITSLFTMPSVISIRVIRERNGERTELKTFTKNIAPDIEKTYIIDVQKNDLICIEVSSCNEIHINDDKRTCLEVVVF